MKSEWNISRRPETMNVPDWERVKTPEMQSRRELSTLYLETVFQEGIPLYGVVSIDVLADEKDRRELTDHLPCAKSAILLGISIEDPWYRLWQRVPGMSMNHFTTITSSKFEIMLHNFADKLEYQGYNTVILQLPLTPTDQNTRLFELAGAGFTGRNHYVITAAYGCRVNLGMIITDAPLLHAVYRYTPYSQNMCSDCTLCDKFCPSGALKDGSYDQEKCESYINNPENQLHISEHSFLKCDACMRVCPLGKSGKWDTQPVQWTTILRECRINY